MPSPPAPDESAKVVSAIVDDELSKLLRRAVGARALVAPLLTIVAAFVLVIDPAPWRRALMIAIIAVAISASALVEIRVRRSGLAAASVPVNVVGTALLQVAVIAGTGGVDSPLLPVMIPVAILASIALGRRTATYALLATQLMCIAALLGVQVAGIGPDLDLPWLIDTPPTTPHRVFAAGVVAVVVVVGSTIGLHVRGRFERMVAAGVEARGEQLQTWAAWSRELEVLGGEIAHELKNPLASIKGLAALVARDVPEGRAAERIEVLQGEVVRMQGILDEFLTFSRPLTPLTIEAVDPVALCRRVVSLHEAAARSAGVELVVSGGGPRIAADGRKLVQVLVNLVQNALAASPPGATVELCVEAEGRGVAIEVRDRGGGVAPELGERAFDPGVTTRADGSGLGLTIARAIARQHDGEVQLLARPGGGAVSRLSLPATSDPTGAA